MKNKCIVFKAQAQGPILSDEDLEQMKAAIPLASECLTCKLRPSGKLTKECCIDL